MSTRYDKYSLKKLMSDLTLKFPGITEIFIFGSRRHRTLSTRSDLDILLLTDNKIKSDDIRDFALQECPVLDFFLMERGVAISCANGSKVRAKSNMDLVYQLNALNIWDKSTGFKNVDIDWDFEVIKGLNMKMTTLMSASPLPSKSNAIATYAPDITVASNKSRWKDIRNHPFSIIALAVIATAGITYAVIDNTRIKPLQEENIRLEKQIESNYEFEGANIIELESTNTQIHIDSVNSRN